MLQPAIKLREGKGAAHDASGIHAAAIVLDAHVAELRRAPADGNGRCPWDEATALVRRYGYCSEGRELQFTLQEAVALALERAVAQQKRQQQQQQQSSSSASASASTSAASASAPSAAAADPVRSTVSACIWTLSAIGLLSSLEAQRCDFTGRNQWTYEPFPGSVGCFKLVGLLVDQATLLVSGPASEDSDRLAATALWCISQLGESQTEAVQPLEFVRLLERVLAERPGALRLLTRLTPGKRLPLLRGVPTSFHLSLNKSCT